MEPQRLLTYQLRMAVIVAIAVIAFERRLEPA
jgi:hypothetical protein